MLPYNAPCPRGCAGIAVILIAVWAISAEAQRVVVETTTLTAVHEAARVYYESAELGTGLIFPAEITLPGPLRSGEPLFVPNPPTVIAGSTSSLRGDMGSGPSFLSSINIAPFYAPPSGALIAPMGRRIAPGCLVYPPAGEAPLLVSLLIKEGQGNILVYPLQVSAGGALGKPRQLLELPGEPLAAAALNQREVVVLCKSAEPTAPVLHVRDVTSKKVRHDAIPLTQAQDVLDTPAPIAMTLSPDRRTLYVLLTGHDTAGPWGAPISALLSLDTASFESRYPPLTFPGVAQTGAALVPDAAGGCWVLTRESSAGFGHVTHVFPEGTALRKVVTQSYRDVWGPLSMVCAPEGAGIAVAFESRLEIWMDGQKATATRTFDAPVRTLAWTSDGLLVGEGNRLHKLPLDSATSLATVSFQGGVVTRVFVIPPELLPTPDRDGDGVTDDVEKRMGTAVDSPDTDGDGIMDGIDPEPLRPSPRLNVPLSITFAAKQAGHSFRAIELDAGAHQGAVWRVRVPRKGADWLRVFPRHGRLPANVAYLGTDPAAPARSDAKLETELEVELRTFQGRSAAGSPATLTVRVAREESAARRILWLEGTPTESGAASFDATALRSVLSAGPHYFSSESAAPPYLDALEPYTVVVVHAADAARGAVSRAALLDYVSRGGALLVLGAVEQAPDENLLQWLGPAGLEIDLTKRVAGQFQANNRDGLARTWRELQLQDGCSVKVFPPAQAIVSTSAGVAGLAVSTYGAGRLAVLAEAAALATDAPRTGELFEWLARALRENQDLDGDRLPDSVEDRNGNGGVDSGETSPLRPDSDGDGIPDGMEDVNLNGTVDPGETSPLNRDSDGDGIDDGADEQPVPSADAPNIARIEPPEAPAEGGGRVTVSGRNLPRDARFFFGDRPALLVSPLGTASAVVAPPPSADENGGVVDVSLRGPAGAQLAVLPAGFRYTPLSTVTFTLAALQTARGEYPGSVAVRVHADTKGPVGMMTFRLQTDPPTALHWGPVMPGSEASQAGRVVSSRPDPTGGVTVDVSPPRRGPYTGVVAIVPWAPANAGSLDAPVVVRVEGGRALAPNGQALRVNTETVSVE